MGSSVLFILFLGVLPLCHALYCNTFVTCNIPTWLGKVRLASGVLLRLRQATAT
jgi:hypothetical protein